jgi:cytochrome b561
MNSAINNERPLLREGYSGIAKFFHWTVAICVLTIIPVGLVMNSLPQGVTQNVAYTVHRSLGALVLVLMILRLGYRLIVGWPAPEPTITAAQRIASHAVHNLLYVLLIVQPALGWYATSVYGATISFFGLFNLPSLAEKNEPASEPLFMVHELLGFAIAGLLVLHIGGALYHYFIRKDGVLQRMLP